MVINSTYAYKLSSCILRTMLQHSIYLHNVATYVRIHNCVRTKINICEHKATASLFDFVNF